VRGGALKYKTLVLQRKNLGSRGRNGGVLQMNQDPVSGEQNDYRETQRDKNRKYMRHLFSGGGRHLKGRSYCRDLTPQSNFISLL